MTKEQIEQAAKEWVSKNYPDVLFQNRLVEIVVKFATSPEAAAYHGQGCDPDFTLWVVVNKWEYDYRTHE